MSNLLMCRLAGQIGNLHELRCAGRIAERLPDWVSKRMDATSIEVGGKIRDHLCYEHGHVDFEAPAMREAAEDRYHGPYHRLCPRLRARLRARLRSWDYIRFESRLGSRLYSRLASELCHRIHRQLCPEAQDA